MTSFQIRPTMRYVGISAGRSLAVLLLLTLAAGCASNGSGSDDPAREVRHASAATTNVAAAEAIRGVLDRQVRAWNSGDVAGFMDGYARTDTLRFASGGSVELGWQRTLQRYRNAYVDREAMGTLAFSDLEIWTLSDDHALVFGRWNLERSEQIGDVGGLFTLLFERGPDGWHIVHDHTSAGSRPDSTES